MGLVGNITLYHQRVIPISHLKISHSAEQQMVSVKRASFINHSVFPHPLLQMEDLDFYHIINDHQQLGLNDIFYGVNW